MTRACNNCDFHDTKSGTCRRNAPRLPTGAFTGVFPKVEKDDWCGEFAETTGAPTLAKAA